MNFWFHILSKILCFLALISLTACGGGNRAADNTFNDKLFTDIVISSNTDDIPIGYSGQLEARIFFADNSSILVTDEVNWTSSDESIAKFDSEYKKLLTAMLVGDVSIQANYKGIESNRLSIRVSDSTLSSIQITPADLNIPSSLGFDYQAMGTFSNGSVLDITPDVNWNTALAQSASSTMSAQSVDIKAEDVLSIDRFGKVNTLSSGNIEVNANVGEVSSPLSKVSVENVNLVEIQITPGNANLPLGMQHQFHAYGFFDNNTRYDLTDVANWESSDNAIGEINEAGLLESISAGSVSISANWNNISANTDVIISNKVLTDIQVTPDNKTLPIISALQMHALGLFSDNSSVDITNLVHWKTDNPDIASINDKGLAVAEKVAETNIKAQLGDISGSAKLSVNNITLDSIQVTPGVQTMWPKAITQFTAMGYYSDGSSHDITDTVSWRTVNANTATVIKGKVTAINEGETSLVAQKLGVVSNEAKVTVLNGMLDTINLSPANATLPVNATLKIFANGHYSDGYSHDISDSVSWRSSDPRLATVLNDGTLIGNRAGNVEIRAYKQGIVSQIANINLSEPVLESIQITPLKRQLPRQVEEQYQALGHYSDGTSHDITNMVTWHSSNTNVARIVYNGKAVGYLDGTVSVYASLGEVKSPNGELIISDATLTDIQLLPPVQNTQVGASVDFDVMGHYSDGTSHDISDTASWFIRDTDIATITQDGTAKGHKEGVTELISRKNGIFSNLATVNVLDNQLTEIQVTPAIKILAINTDCPFVAKGKYADGTVQNISRDITWISNNPNIAYFTSEGILQTLSTGEVEISARKGNIISNIARISVVPGEISELRLSSNSLDLIKGTNHKLESNAIYSNGNHQQVSSRVTWQSADSSIATVSNRGDVVAISTGDTFISVRFGDVTHSIPITVSDGIISNITVSINDARITTGNTLNVDASATFESGRDEYNNRFFEWRSSNTDIATISEDGMITAVAAGSALITASKNDITSPIIAITVVDAQLQSIELSPEGSRILSKDSNFQFYATGVFQGANGEQIREQITNRVNWSSSNTSNVTVDTEGQIHTVNIGESVLKASMNSIDSNNVSITVTNSALSSIRLVNKATSSDLAVGNHRRLHPEGVFDDGSIQNIDGKVLWRTTGGIYHHFNDWSGSLITALSAGAATVEIALNGMTAQASLNILPAGSYPCASPTITVEIDGALRTFHCPKEISEVNNEDGHIVESGGWNYPAGMKVALFKVDQYNGFDMASACSNEGLQHVTVSQVRKFANALGYDSFNFKAGMVIDYGWPINLWIVTSTPIQYYSFVGLPRSNLNSTREIYYHESHVAYCVDW